MNSPIWSSSVSLVLPAMPKSFISKKVNGLTLLIEIQQSSESLISSNFTDKSIHLGFLNWA